MFAVDTLTVRRAKIQQHLCSTRSLTSAASSVRYPTNDDVSGIALGESHPVGLYHLTFIIPTVVHGSGDNPLSSPEANPSTWSMEEAVEKYRDNDTASHGRSVAWL